MARKKRPSFSTVVSLMSDNAQARIESQSLQTIDTLPLNVIIPDFSQPRSLLPPDLATALVGGQKTTAEVLTEWQTRAELQPANVGLQRNIRELRRLADSIAQHGLINPISVREPHATETRPQGIRYLIVTGERRYWAHVYLLINNKQINEGDNVLSPDQIKVTIAPTGVSVKAHQLIENLLRENINAVERARGMWALRYELSGVNDSSPASNDETGEGSEAQRSLVPWRQVEETLGISKRYRIFVTSVLNLCDEAIEIVARHNLPEMTIRPIVQKLKARPDLQVQALNQLVAWQAENAAEDGPGRSIVASVKELVDQLLTPEKGSEQNESPKITRSVSSEPVIRFRDKVRQTLDFLNRLKQRDRVNLNSALQAEKYVDVLLDLRNLRQQIDEILVTADKTLPQSADDPINASQQE